jgi:hypothetical protein
MELNIWTASTYGLRRPVKAFAFKKFGRRFDFRNFQPANDEQQKNGKKAGLTPKTRGSGLPFCHLARELRADDRDLFRI